VVVQAAVLVEQRQQAEVQELQGKVIMAATQVAAAVQAVVVLVLWVLLIV
jgi:hypothetical protein